MSKIKPIQKISEKHIEELYVFTRKHYVEFYDLQTELVDHLANDIEAIWESKPELTFYEARDISFKKFGIFGFTDVVEKRQAVMQKRYNEIIWSFVKEWFKLPKIILTGLIFIIFYTLLKTENSTQIGMGFLFVSVFVVGIRSFLLGRKLKTKKNNKLWLMESVIFNQELSFLGVVYGQSYIISEAVAKTQDNLFFLVLVSTLFTFMILYSYVSLYVIPKQSEELLKQTYPEYSM